MSRSRPYRWAGRWNRNPLLRPPRMPLRKKEALRPAGATCWFRTFRRRAKFYLPQWVAFDDHDRLLVNSVSEAHADIKSMQRFLNVLFAARSLAPYIIVDEEYQNKHYGMLGQLVNQGRALARFMTADIIRTVKMRARGAELKIAD